jgi:hypothetical protein
MIEHFLALNFANGLTIPSMEVNTKGIAIDMSEI